MAMPNLKTLKPLRHALYAFLDSYGGGETADAVRAIAGSILSVQTKAKQLVLPGLEIEAWVDALVQDFDPSRLAEHLWNEGEKAIAMRAKRWQEILEVKARATLDAYIQTHAPNLDTTQISDVVTTILPIVEDAQISRDEVKRLLALIRHQFDGPSAASRVLDPKWIVLADKVAQAIRNRDVETTVLETVRAYRAQFQPALVELGEDLVEAALKVIANDQADLGLDLVLDPETQRLVIKQVSFKLKFMEASPSASKSLREIAQQVHTEVLHYRKAHGLDQVSHLPTTIQTDEAQGSSPLGGELSIRIEINRSSQGSIQPTTDPTNLEN